MYWYTVWPIRRDLFLIGKVQSHNAFKLQFGWMRHNSIFILTIADVTNSKRHQWQDEILINFPRTVQEISKVVGRKLVSETHTFITSLCCMKSMHYSKRMLCKQGCIKLSGHIAWQSLFENNFADFSNVVQVKKIKISSSHWRRF